MIEDLEMFEVVFSYIFDCKDKFTILFKLYLVQWCAKEVPVQKKTNCVKQRASPIY